MRPILFEIEYSFPMTPSSYVAPRCFEVQYSPSELLLDSSPFTTHPSSGDDRQYVSPLDAPLWFVEPSDDEETE